MRRVDAAQLWLLSVEAVRDALRRRVVLVVVVICLLCLAMLNSCTSCDADIQVTGDISRSLDVLGWAGFGVFCVLSLWIITLAGLLAADHLTQSLSDGSALLVLSRPVGRETFALARLAGSLVVSLGAGLVLLGGATFLLSARSGLDVEPALFATLACVTSSLCVAACAMTASLYLPRVAIFLLVFVGVAVVSVLNLVSISGVELHGLYHVVDRFGPPFASSIALSLAPWSGREPEGLSALQVGLRLLLWAVAGLAVLAFCFRRREIPGIEER